MRFLYTFIHIEMCKLILKHTVTFYYIPTHFLRKHDLYLFCAVGPGHLLPPHLGAGRVQVLFLMKSRRPLPHVSEHAPYALHCPQEPQLPFTVVVKT